MPEPLHHLECLSFQDDVGRPLLLPSRIAPSPCTQKAMPDRASDYPARRDLDRLQEEAQTAGSDAIGSAVRENGLFSRKVNALGTDIFLARGS